MLFYLLTPPIMAMINKHGFRTIYFLMPCVALAIYFCAYLHHSNINLMLYRFVSYIIGLFCAQAALDKSIVRTRKIIGGGNFVPLINVSFADSAKETRPVNT